MKCRLCGSEREMPHTCNPRMVRAQMAEEAAKSLEGYAERYPADDANNHDVVRMLVRAQAEAIRFAGRYPVD